MTEETFLLLLKFKCIVPCLADHSKTRTVKKNTCTNQRMFPSALRKTVGSKVKNMLKGASKEGRAGLADRLGIQGAGELHVAVREGCVYIHCDP